MLFGNAPISVVDLATLFQKKFRTLITDSRRTRTRELKRLLRQKGTQLRFDVFPTHNEPHEHPKREWLLDLVWWDDTPGKKRAVLAVESEWGNTDAILDDFEKLMSFKAPLKLMVYKTTNHVRQSASIRMKLENYMKEFGHHIRGEKYVLIEVELRKAVTFYVFRYMTQKHGKIKQLRFRSLFSASQLPKIEGPLTVTLTT